MKLRPHHGMCLAFFIGEGYSDDFNAHTAEVLRRLREEDPVVQIVPWTDEVCAACPNHKDGQCRSGPEADRYDGKVLALCGLPPGANLRWSAFSGLVRNRILEPGKRQEICGDCRWNELCTAQGKIRGIR